MENFIFCAVVIKLKIKVLTMVILFVIDKADYVQLSLIY